MISSGRKTLRDSFEELFTVMKDLARFAVHQRRGTNDLASEYFPDRLMTKTNTQYWNRFMKMADNVLGNAGVHGCSGAGRNDEPGRFQPFDFLNCYFVISKYTQFLAKLAEILHEVICKRIVVIDDEN